jgi:hypothetical protein
MKKKSTCCSAPARRPVLRSSSATEGGSLGEAGLPAVPSSAVALLRRVEASREGGFLNLRVLFGLCVMLAGVFLALVSFGTFSSVFAQTNKTNPIQQAVQFANNAPASDLKSADPVLNPQLARPPRVVYGNPKEGAAGPLQGPQAPEPSQAWGSQQGSTWIAASQFAVRLFDTEPVLTYDTFFFFNSPGSAAPTPYFAQLTVEPGLRINRIGCVSRDNSLTHSVTFIWYKYLTNLTTGVTTTHELDSFATSGTPGVSVGNLFPPAGEETMHVYDGALSVINHYIFAQVAGDTFFAGCWVFHQRQVAPGPASATFSDVPRSSPWFPYVEALVDTGVTGGCAPGMYCPNDPVTRGQMATFLAKALGMGFPF